MRDALILVGYSLVSGFVCFYGLLMLFSPEKSIRLGDWLAGADRWSTRKPDWKPGISTRIGGLLMAAMGGFMFIMPLFWLLTPSQEPVSPPPVTSIGHSPDWLSFAVGLVTFFGGLYIALSPNALVRWARKSMPHRILPEEIPGKGIFWAWIIGGLFMLSSITAFRAWLKSL